ncbi:mCG59231 [Mus musculus]|nr:mCG59231 [Mus musculus]
MVGRGGFFSVSFQHRKDRPVHSGPSDGSCPEVLRLIDVGPSALSDQNMELVITWYHGIPRSWHQETCFGHI